MRASDHLLYRHHGAEHVRHIRDRHHPGARGEQPLEFGKEEIVIVMHRSPFDNSAMTLAKEVTSKKGLVILPKVIAPILKTPEKKQ
jgi:hypothetical protein